MIKKADIVYNSQGQLLDVYLPDGKINAVFLYIHGGGIEAGSKNDGNYFAAVLAKQGISTVSINYRLYPDAKFPEFVEDCADAVAWVFQNKELFGGCDKIFVGGSSAGGYLSMMLCFDKRYLEKHGIHPMDISGYVHDSGQPTAHFNVLREKGMDVRRVVIDETAPLYFVGLEKEYPPMLFIVADQDMENRYEQTVLVRSTMDHFGYDLSKAELKLMHGRHCAHVSADNEQGENVLGTIVRDFILKEI